MNFCCFVVLCPVLGYRRHRDKNKWSREAKRFVFRNILVLLPRQMLHASATTFPHLQVPWITVSRFLSYPILKIARKKKLPV